MLLWTVILPEPARSFLHLETSDLQLSMHTAPSEEAATLLRTGTTHSEMLWPLCAWVPIWLL